MEIRALGVYSKRWCILKKGGLCYFKHETDDLAECFGFVDLRDCEINVKNDTHFEVVHKEKKPIFRKTLPGICCWNHKLIWPSGKTLRLPATMLHHKSSHICFRVTGKNELTEWTKQIRLAIANVIVLAQQSLICQAPENLESLFAETKVEQQSIQMNWEY